MGLWSWLFPSEADQLVRARELMAKGRYEKARKLLVHCSQPDAEKLYDECSAAVDRAGATGEKSRLAAQGFHGWKIDVSTANARRKRELEALVAQEIEKAGLDLGALEIDEAAVKAAVARAQRRASQSGGSAVGSVRLVPIVDPSRGGR